MQHKHGLSDKSEEKLRYLLNIMLNILGFINISCHISVFPVDIVRVSAGKITVCLINKHNKTSNKILYIMSWVHLFLFLILVKMWQKKLFASVDIKYQIDKAEKFSLFLLIRIEYDDTAT